MPNEYTIEEIEIEPLDLEGIRCEACAHRETCSIKADEFVLESLPNHRCPGFEKAADCACVGCPVDDPDICERCIT